MKARGKYNTRQKEEILRALTNFGTHSVTAEELVLALRVQGSSAGKTTVYRNLEQMANEGSVLKSTGSQGALYQYVGSTCSCDSHLHCQCSRCGRIAHVDCECFHMLTSHLLNEHHFVLDANHTMLVGLCEQCQKEEMIHGPVDA